MSRKHPINSLKLFNCEFMTRENNIKIKVTSKWLKRLFKNGYYVDEVNELWFDDPEGGLEYNNWVDVYGEGIWDMNQKEVDDVAKKIVRDFSHLTRRPRQKALSRAFSNLLEDKTLLVYLYARDKWGCDYTFLFRKRGDKNGK